MERERLQRSLAEAMEKEQSTKRSRRMNLMQMTEWDRKRAMANSVQLQAAEIYETEKNIVTKFFQRPTHQAYEYRARQDAVQRAIGDKFYQTVTPNRNLASFERPKPDDDFEARMLQQKQARRKKELEVQRAQDEQLRQQKLAREQDERLKRERGLKIEREAEVYAAEQRKARQQKI